MNELSFITKHITFLTTKYLSKIKKLVGVAVRRKKNINLNYKIVFLPQKHQDYIIVHELCHLKEFNHSRKFWALVGKNSS